MHLNIGQKIFGIAAVVLSLMVAVSVYSIQLTATISEELRVIAKRDLPITQAVGHINVAFLDQAVVLERVLAMNPDDEDDRQALAKEQGRHQKLVAKVIAKFDHAREMLRLAKEEDIAKHLNIIETHYQAFEAHSVGMMTAHGMQDHDVFESLKADLETKQDNLSTAIGALHDHLAAITDQAVQKVNRDEQKLLIVNSALTVLATVLSILFAGLVTRIIVRNVRKLVQGAQAVQDGQLDTEVQISTQDEIGRLSVAFNDMVGGLRLKERIKDTFGKYMDPRIVSGLLDHPEFTDPGGERREMSVMFIDLKGFTSISEALQPDELVFMVNDFFGHMTDAISMHQGVVDKFMGDAVMAYWGPPFCDADAHATLACKAGQEALRRLDAFREDVRTKLGAAADGLEIDLRIGISSGDMIVGTIGSTASRNFTVMGDPVNLGSRLEGANKAYGTHILVSDRTHELVGKDLPMREIDLIRVKGKQEPVRVFELLTDEQDIQDFSPGLLAYRAQDWDGAETVFSQTRGDTAAQAYLNRISQLRKSPPPADWDGVWVFDTK
ncbi:adenylate/guanylate cyclase domain-containing protein [Magnetovibrio sp. PR-2]|uniref:adenylate/guanylate cyclase domain-containing protein n=1 Tax=Magnetovibrio sp. PR-2 TaxID=3120356 RepID=UPI002FCE2EAE